MIGHCRGAAPLVCVHKLFPLAPLLVSAEGAVGLVISGAPAALRETPGIGSCVYSVAMREVNGDCAGVPRSGGSGTGSSPDLRFPRVLWATCIQMRLPCSGDAGVVPRLTCLCASDSLIFER